MSNTKKKNKPVVETFPEATPAETTPVDAVDPNTVAEEPKACIGKVKGCDHLNVRARPAADAKIICRISVNTEVQIDKDNSTKDFYKVCTVSGVNGYCMKKYISVKK